jgi:hypothetical protein
VNGARSKSIKTFWLEIELPYLRSLFWDGNIDRSKNYGINHDGRGIEMERMLDAERKLGKNIWGFFNIYFGFFIPKFRKN